MRENISLLRRKLIIGAAASAALGGWHTAKAQEVAKVLVGFPAGGAIDMTARVYAEQMRGLGPMIVENRPGASGNIAATALAQSRPDGNTIMLAPVNVYSISQALYRNLGFDTARDFEPISIVAKFPWVLAVHTSVPAQNIAELIKWIKEDPKRGICGMAATGSEGHLMAYAFSQAANLPITFAGYKGGAPMAQDLMGGHIPMAFDPIVNLAQPHKAGKVRVLAVTSTERSALLPAVPTFGELGYAAATGETWIGASIRRGSPAERVQAFSKAFQAAAQMPEVRDRLAGLGLSAVGSSAREMANAIVADGKRYTELIKTMGLKIE